MSVPRGQRFPWVYYCGLGSDFLISAQGVSIEGVREMRANVCQGLPIGPAVLKRSHWLLTHPCRGSVITAILLCRWGSCEAYCLWESEFSPKHIHPLWSLTQLRSQMKLPIMTAKMVATSEPPSLGSTYPLEMNDDKFKGSKAAFACLSTTHCCWNSFFFPDYKVAIQSDCSVSRLKPKFQFPFPSASGHLNALPPFQYTLLCQVLPVRWTKVFLPHIGYKQQA